ncbi:unnamed protein product [Blepharisma stoltei]|uniref:Major facilitator superfamily (MFS) profile domain-containing protein n=1 Tax=Blepharisma stoltei TaxID=1481888 RepID=A0AAU9J2A7_9CILI|nr:unnamed protein product [Blepharisma stoltei]
MSSQEVSEEDPLIKPPISVQFRTLKSLFYKFFESDSKIYVVLINIFLTSLSSYTLFYSIRLFLSEDLDYSDSMTGTYYAIFGLCIALYLLLLGTYVDVAGHEIALMQSGLLLICGAILITFIENAGIFITTLYTAISIGIALGIASSKTSIKDYTTKDTGNVAIALAVIFIIGTSPLSGIIVNFSSALAGDNYWEYRVGFLVGSFFALMTIIGGFYLNNYSEVHNEVGLPDKSYLQSFREAVKTKRFWRFFVLSFLLTLEKTSFRHLDATLPTYMEREIGENANYGIVLAFNLVAVVVFTICFIPLSYYYNSYSVVTIGALVSGISPLFFLFGSTYVTCSAFAIGVALAESLIVPRMMDYAFHFAPHGEVGVYIGILSAKYYLAMTISGLMSGFLLEEFCPEDGERDCQYMWLIIAAVALIAPLTMWIFRSWIEQPLNELDPYIVDEENEVK